MEYSTSHDQVIQIVPVVAQLPPPEQPQPALGIAGQPGSSTITEESVMILSESIINTLPLAIYNKLPRIPDETVKNFNHELVLYCQRKGINPMDYLFDEFGLVVCGIGIVGTHYSNYQEIYGKNKKTKDDKGTEAYLHALELAKAKEEEQKRKDLEQIKREVIT